MKVDIAQYMITQAQRSSGNESQSQRFSDMLDGMNLSDKEEQVFQGISTVFYDWQEEYLGRGIGADARQNVIENSEAFLQIMGKAVEEGGYENPKAFLESLSSSELEVVQHMNGLADKIYPQSLTEEGALNLILPRNAPQDLNNDAIVMRGEARTFHFPPVNAPEAVHQAWAEATEGMSEKDIFLMQGAFLVAPNFKLDSEGRVIAVYEPGDPEHVNPFTVEGFSYSGMLEQRLESLEAFKHKMDVNVYEKRKMFFEKFLSALPAGV